MKRLVFALAAASALAAFAVYLNHINPPTVLAPETPAESTTNLSEPELPPSPKAGDAVAEVSPSNAVVADESTADTGSRTPASRALAPAPTKELRLGLEQSIGTLLSRQVAFEQKQATWKQLRKAGKLDPVIADLEQRAVDEPQSADTAAALGQAYFQKCAAIDDIREQAILIMKADEAFDAALKLDPSNWEARYTKAVAMSYWPTELNKGNEVIEQFRTLIEQQETRPPQPEFAQTYVRLGEQYAKAGHPDSAAQVWQRGAALFPDDGDLKKKLVGDASAQ